MTTELDAGSRSSVNCPSPPGVASRVVRLARDPDRTMSGVATSIGMDPGLSRKVLRIASPPRAGASESASAAEALPHVLSAAHRHASGDPWFAGRCNRTHRLAVLLASLTLAAGLAHAAPGVATGATPTTDEAVEMSEPMRTAVLLAKAAGGGVGFVGSSLAIDQAATRAEVAIIQPVPVEKMKTGEIVMLVKDDCKSPTGCLMARRITEKRGSDVATIRYGRSEAESDMGVDASVVGRVAYVVDLNTGHIRDMRSDDTKEISFVEALRRESKKRHYVGNIVRPRPLRI
jgi:hypothetical protein